MFVSSSRRVVLSCLLAFLSHVLLTLFVVHLVAGRLAGWLAASPSLLPICSDFVCLLCLSLSLSISVFYLNGTWFPARRRPISLNSTRGSKSLLFQRFWAGVREEIREGEEEKGKFFVGADA